MQIDIKDPILQTQIFAVVLLILLTIFARKREDKTFLPNSVTDELKGLAILVIVLSHIGFFLAKDTHFLYPLSILAGVGVNLFLFLSGFGLSMSTLRSKLSITEFYKKRLPKLFLPLWIVLAALTLLDKFFLNKTYSLDVLVKSFLGYYPSADIFNDLNSPLWYFTLILFYYLIFPFVFWKRKVFLAFLLTLLLSVFLIRFNLPLKEDLSRLYKLHTLAFPLGILFAGLLVSQNLYLKKIKSFIKKWFIKIQSLNLVFNLILMIPLIAIFIYTAFYSGVGESSEIEQTLSLINMFSIIAIFLLKNIQMRFLIILGIYSYEIYLMHWPILYRHDLFYNYLPGSLATLLYLGLFIILGIGLKKIISFVLK